MNDEQSEEHIQDSDQERTRVASAPPLQSGKIIETEIKLFATVSSFSDYAADTLRPPSRRNPCFPPIDRVRHPCMQGVRPASVSSRETCNNGKSQQIAMVLFQLVLCHVMAKLIYNSKFFIGPKLLRGEANQCL